MQTINVTEFRKNLAQHLDETVSSRAPLVVSRGGKHRNVVMIAADEYEGLIETLHLLGSKNNADRLLRSIDQANAGGATERL